MTSIYTGRLIGERLCNALGIDSSRVFSITLQARADAVFTVLIEQAVTTEQADALTEVVESETKTYRLVENTND
jgi:hypothetical protein